MNGLLIGALTGLVARQSAVPDDVNGLLIAALTGLVARQSAVAAKSCCSCPSMRCQTERASWLVSTTEERSRGSIAEATCLQGGADDDVNGLMIAALTGLVARQSAVAAKSCCSCPSMRCQTERASWLVSEMQWRSGHAD